MSTDPFTEVPPKDPLLLARQVAWSDRLVVVYEGGDSYRVILSRYGRVRGVTCTGEELNDLGPVLLKLKEEFR